MRGIACVFVAVSLVLLTAVAVYGDRVARTDGNDTPSPLDIARVGVKHRSGHTNIFIHKVRMHDAWELAQLRARTGNRVTITCDVRRNVGYGCTGCISEREVVIIVRHGELRATLYNHLGDPPKRLRSLPVWKPNPSTVAFALTRKQLRRSAYRSYDWGVVTYFQSGSVAECRDGCSDLAPNRRYGLITHSVE